MYEIMLTFLIALIGALIALRLKIPAAPMLGGMIGVAVFNVMTDAAYFPVGVKNMTQMISGLFIGCGITRSEIVSLRNTIKPALMNVLMIIIASLSMGFLLYLMTDFSFATTAFASAPGGLVDMTIISIDMGADTSVVSILQTVRLLSILGVFPILFKTLLSKNNRETEGLIDMPEIEASLQKVPDKSKTNMAMTLGIALVSATIGGLTGIPAGPLVFTMIGVSLQNIFSATAYMPKALKVFAQICAGALIGGGINQATILGLRYTLVPAFMMIVGFILIVLLLAFILTKTTQLDLPTALFACAPGGAADMALIAEDFGASAPKVSIIQTMRLVCVIIFYPLVIQIASAFI